MAEHEEFPVIDVRDIDSRTQELADEITLACKTWGFFLIKNHPIPLSDIDHMFALSQEFYSLPADQKDPYPIDATRTGYVGAYKDKNKDDKESMYFGGVRDGLDASTPSIPPFWHPHLPAVERFRAACHGLALQLLRCFAISLGLEEDYFADGEQSSPLSACHKPSEPPGSQLRLLHYPARPAASPEGITRLIAHSDSQSVTLLFQRRGGLDVRSPAGAWVRAPARDGCILVNVGDALQFWSGGRLKSTMHRVTFEGLPQDQARYSMAYFCGANRDTMLEPLGGGTGLELKGFDGKSVKGVTAGEYFARQFEDLYGTYSKGKKDVDGIGA